MHLCESNFAPFIQLRALHTISMTLFSLFLCLMYIGWSLCMYYYQRHTVCGGEVSVQS